MFYDNSKNLEIINKLKTKFTDYPEKIEIPPPIFLEMEGRVLEYDEVKKTMNISFPVKNNYFNPFGNLQGGMVAAAVDNTFGPLSMLCAPPNFTRKLEVKYKKPINCFSTSIIVIAEINEIDDRRLILSAVVKNNENKIVATAKSLHWIV